MSTSGRFSNSKIRDKILQDKWVFPQRGLETIRPQSVSVIGGSTAPTIVVRDGGAVGASNASTIYIDGVFTPAFDNYLVVISGYAFSSGTIINLRSNSQTPSGTYSTRYREIPGSQGGSTAPSGIRVNSTSFTPFPTLGLYPNLGPTYITNTAFLYFYGPNLNSTTIIQSFCGSWTNNVSPFTTVLYEWPVANITSTIETTKLVCDGFGFSAFNVSDPTQTYAVNVNIYGIG